MTDIDDLIARLVEADDDLPNASGQWYELVADAAAALREQRDEIARLEQLQRNNEGRIKEIVDDHLLQRAEKAEAESYMWELKNAENVGKYERELNALRADLRAEERGQDNLRRMLADAEAKIERLQQMCAHPPSLF